MLTTGLDTSVDGDKNSVYEVNTSGLPRGLDNPHGNAIRAEATLLATEQAAQREINAARARFWRVVNPQSLNHLDRPVAYRCCLAQRSARYRTPEHPFLSGNMRPGTSFGSSRSDLLVAGSGDG